MHLKKYTYIFLYWVCVSFLCNFVIMNAFIINHWGTRNVSKTNTYKTESVRKYSLIRLKWSPTRVMSYLTRTQKFCLMSIRNPTPNLQHHFVNPQPEPKSKKQFRQPATHQYPKPTRSRNFQTGNQSEKNEYIF